MISLQPSEEQREMVNAVAACLRAEMPAERLRGLEHAVTASDHKLWPALGTLGLFAIALPEQTGGSGCSIAEEVLLFRELGRVAGSPSMIATAVGAQLAYRLGDNDLASRIAAGSEPIGLAVAANPALPIRDGGGLLQIVDAGRGEFVLAWDETGAGLCRVAELGDHAPAECIDWTLSLGQARLAQGAELLWVERSAFDAPGTIRLLTAAMLCGLAQGATDLGVEYVKVREQFGQRLGAFQAVKHRCADMAKRNLAAWSQTCFAALVQQQHGADTVFQALAASMLAVEAAVQNAEATIQNFGAIGFTAENLVHFYLKRAHVLDRIAGGTFWQQRAFMAEPNPVLAA
jgi:alkylation response protein AidB-like acyl-CoA dehydrogenase